MQSTVFNRAVALGALTGALLLTAAGVRDIVLISAFLISAAVVLLALESRFDRSLAQAEPVRTVYERTAEAS